jgi:hypothetical protein
MFSLTNTAGGAAKVSVNGGNNQSATVGTAFTNALAVTVTDQYNNVVSGATVIFTPPGSGASASLSTPATTNGNGITSVTAAANTKAGSYTVTASVSGGTQSATFNLTNNAGAAAGISVYSGSGQTATVNTSFTNPLVALVTDQYNNPVGTGTVTFTAVPAGNGASATIGGSPATISGGQASVTATASTKAGAYTVSATVTGSALTPATFSLTNAVGAPANMALTGGNNQTATVNTAFANPLTVTVTDQYNNPVPSQLVTFTPPATGASITFAGGLNTATTNASGVATSAAITANSTAGSNYSVQAKAGTATNNFTLTNVGPPVLAIAKTSTADNGGHFSQGQNNATYTLTVSNTGVGSTTAPIGVTDNPGTGLTVLAMSGTGWICATLPTCTYAATVGSGGVANPLTVTAAVSATAPSSVTNGATASGGGEIVTSTPASDTDTVNPIVNVSSQVQFNETGFSVNRLSKLWTSTITVANQGTATIAGPVQVVLNGLMPGANGITMSNNTGLRNGLYYITVSPGSIAPGGSASVYIQFMNPNNALISFTPVTDSGTF